ncbi:LysR family transcriptional regulator [Caballeronia sp. GAWG1-1]|uniref:LysR family transcriptional regulator n=1 Tax=Caballeronia sp. GAWG1-1 TaxID=2921742 RepID=UPI002028F64E|nr:LysR family transcriptional regulator [Caballeronia sp. GAWG1-1]
MTDRIQAMRTFVRIVETNSFTRAAQSLDIPTATATRILQQLESMLGTQLLIRTTRRLSVTIEGAEYYDRCSHILADVDALEASLRDQRQNPSGRLRVEMPWVAATAVVLPALQEFHERYPLIDLAMGVSHRDVDLVAEGVDCSIQLGALPDSLLVARRLGSLDYVTCASPEYLLRKGVPRDLDELGDHVAVKCMSEQNGQVAGLDFQVDGVSRVAEVRGFLASSDEHAYVTAGLQGLGLIQPARIVAQPFIEAGRLQEVLHPFKPAPTPVSVAYVKGRHESRRVRVFVDWLAELFGRTKLIDADLSRVRHLIESERCSA